MKTYPWRILPNPFLSAKGELISSPEAWPERRREMEELVIGTEYGGMPAEPWRTDWEELHTSTIRWMEGTSYRTGRIYAWPSPHAAPFHFLMDMHIPPGKGPFPVVLYGDGCWRYSTDEVIAEVIRRGMILARFNRVEIAPDIKPGNRLTGIYPVFAGETYGALAAWAWGYKRCVDVLSGMDVADASKITVTGHSRGGKTVLLAGAADQRIALTGANNSGSGGAGSYLSQAPGSETMADSLRAFAFWYGPDLRQYVGREETLPFDQHFLKALIAPRSLLTMEALGDLWANPRGTWLTHAAAREVYRFLGAEDCIGITYREGGHNHGIGDWRTFLDFMEWRLCGKEKRTDYNLCPFDDLAPCP